MAPSADSRVISDATHRARRLVTVGHRHRQRDTTFRLRSTVGRRTDAEQEDAGLQDRSQVLPHVLELFRGQLERHLCFMSERWRSGVGAMSERRQRDSDSGKGKEKRGERGLLGRRGAAAN